MLSRARGGRVLVAAGWVSSVLAGARPARAQGTEEGLAGWLSRPMEFESHGLVAPFAPSGIGTGLGLGAGVRLDLEILRPGFVPSIDDAVSIGLGADFVHYQGNGIVVPGTCQRFAAGPGGTSVCVEVNQPGGPSTDAFFPLTLQWNLFLSRDWSVLVEPGISLDWADFRSLDVSPALFLGGRWRLADGLTITLRVGYPTVSLGASFLF